MTISITFRTFCLLVLVLCAFAANSVLARMALADQFIDPVSFTLVRLISGALLLWALTGKRGVKSGSVKGGVWLILYALLFSLAYVLLPAGTGALILFAAVQITMIGGGLFTGERLRIQQWAGVVIAVLGLFWLMSPGLERPSVLGSIMMVISGAGWGLYSLNGKGSADPLADTAGNFLRGAAMLLVLAPFILWLGTDVYVSLNGLIFALLSGMVTSALGYALWYHVLTKLTSIQAGVSQLTVPVIAAIGGLIFLSEPMTLNYMIASAVILGGVGLAILRNPK